MSMREREDNFFIGFMIGAIIPVAGYFLIGQLFALMTQMGMMDEVTIGSSGQRDRTTLLLAIACNILSIQYLTRRRRGNNMIKGVVTATLIYAGMWIYRYLDVLLQNF